MIICIKKNTSSFSPCFYKYFIKQIFIFLFQPPPETTRHGVIRGYYVGYKVSESEEFYTFKQVQRSSSSDKEATYITGLQPFTQYDIVVKAFNSAGTGPQSIKITGKTLETGIHLTDCYLLFLKRSIIFIDDILLYYMH